MKKERLKYLAGLNESNDKVMYAEYRKDITKSITLARDKAKALDVDWYTFSNDVETLVKEALEKLEKDYNE